MKTRTYKCIQFSIYFFTFLMLESEVNSRAEILLGSQYVIQIYALGLLCTAFGYFLFALSSGKGPKITRWNVPYIISSLLCLVSVSTLLYASNRTLYFFSSVLSLLSFGFIGGHVHFNCSLLFSTEKRPGLMLGISAGAGVILQFIFQNLIPFNAIIIIGVILCVFISFIMPIEANPDTDSGAETDPQVLKTKDLILPVIATAIMTMILTTNDDLMVMKNAAGEVHLFSFTRLFYALGLMLSGIITDIKKQNWLPFSCVASMMLSVIACVFLSKPSTYNLNMSVMYFYSGFYVMYFTAVFMSMAANTKRPAFTAGLGRITRSVVTSLFTLFLYTAKIDFSISFLIILNCTLSIFLLVLFTVTKKLYPVSSKDAPSKTFPSPEETVLKMGELYSLTEREKETLFHLLYSEDGVQEIADKLFISRRVLQRYISSIYEKTGVHSRIGLYQLRDQIK